MSSSSAAAAASYKFVDIGANLLDEKFTDGIYFGKPRHEPDFEQVLSRAQENGVTHIILTAGTLRESKRAVEMVRQLRAQNSNVTFGCTVGVHPTRCQQEFVDIVSSDSQEDEGDDEAKPKTAQQVLQALQEVAIDGISDQSLVALGEIGLDYDRLEFCPKDVQQKYLQEQLTTFLAKPELQKLPLFLHNRNVNSDLLQVLQKQDSSIRGVVHSFDDSLELAMEFIHMGLYIGLNGCSLKTTENLEVVKQLPLEMILLETDCPYCEIKPTHAGFGHVQTKFEKKVEKKFESGKMVKGRNEPCQMIQVAEVIAGVKGLPVQQVVDACFENSMQLYGNFGQS